MKIITNYKESLLYLCMIISIIVLCVILNISLFWGFLICNLILVTILHKMKYNSKQIIIQIKTGISECKILYIIILLMGANIALWMSSGVIPTIVTYGFQYMQNVNYILFCFLSTGIVAVIMGTGLGTLSTIGIALLGIGKGFGLPVEIMLGAIVSGAFISDKISPVSALTNLTIATVGTNYRDYFKKCLPTLLTTMILSAIIYIIIGNLNPATVELHLISNYQNIIKDTFLISPYLLLLPLLVIVLAVIGISVVKNMMTIFVSGILLTIFMQGYTLAPLLNTILYGFQVDSGNPFIDSILRGGGIAPMIEVIGIVLGAIILNALLSLCKMLNPLVDMLMKNTNSKFKLILKTSILSTILTSITCDQTVGIIVPGKELQPYYHDLDVDITVLARTISDSGTIVAPLEFWNVNSLIIIGLTGVSTLTYAPYAVLCFISPLVTIAFSLIKSKNRDVST